MKLKYLNLSNFNPVSIPRAFCHIIHLRMLNLRSELEHFVLQIYSFSVCKLLYSYMFCVKEEENCNYRRE